MGGPLFTLVGVIAVVIILIIARSIKIIPQSETVIVERLGKYYKTLDSGLQFIVPILDKARVMDWFTVRKLPNGRSVMVSKKTTNIDLREHVYDFPRQNVITRDNVVIEIDAIIYYQIMDPIKACYEINNVPNAIEKLAKTTLRNIIGDMDLDETLSSRDEINNKMRLILDEATDKWGVKVNRVEIQDINPPQDIKDAMEKQMRAERDRRAKILTAEGEKQSKILESEGFKQSQINKADGDKQAEILRAEGRAQAQIKEAEAESVAINKITESIKNTNTDPGTYLIALKYMETLNKISSGKDSKMVYMPYEATGVLGSVGSIKDMFKIK